MLCNIPKYLMVWLLLFVVMGAENGFAADLPMEFLAEVYAKLSKETESKPHAHNSFRG